MGSLEQPFSNLKPAARHPLLPSYVHSGPLPPTWTMTPHKVCAADEIAWLGRHPSLVDCQAEATSSGSCAAAPTRTVMYCANTTQCTDCYCANTTECTETTSPQLNLFVEPRAIPLPMTPTSTGLIYTLS